MSPTAGKKATKREQATGCGCLVVIVLLIVAGCNALFAGDEPAPGPMTPTPAVSASVPSATAEPAEDLDEDGIEDTLDNDADGDGVRAANDIDDLDPDKGKRRPKRTPTARPEPEPVRTIRPGAFCGDPGAVGVGSNGRTYTCRDGHWRR
ncbi:hypothetical protein HII36_17855 [Nonomuraea sp. NN258]|uniref:hypothetical protein n=1 Tax=Nonomuraea antri TaxID=2730852 RepID=UPI001569C2CC|nr:hypothetical protein [Nonomuraea antri]NRQ33700.1 hypothetical protein [Nonomuraea antri]